MTHFKLIDLYLYQFKVCHGMTHFKLIDLYLYQFKVCHGLLL